LKADTAQVNKSIIMLLRISWVFSSKVLRGLWVVLSIRLLLTLMK